MNTRWIQLLLVLWVGLLPAEVLQLEDALNEGLKKGFSIRIARLQGKAAENNRILAPAGLLPKVDLTGRISKTSTDPVSPFGRDGITSDAGASASWVLFDGLRMFKAYSLVHASADLGEIQEREAVENAVAGIFRAWLNLSVQQVLLSNLKEQASISSERLELLKSRQELGAATGREILASQVGLFSDSSALLEQERVRRSSARLLELSLGREPTGELFVPDSFSLPQLRKDYGEWERRALERNVGLRGSHLAEKIERLNGQIARSAFWPVLVGSVSWTRNWQDLNLGSGGGGVNWSSLYPDREDKTRLGLSVQWNVFNGFQDYNSSRNHGLDLRRVRAGKMLQELQLKNLLREQWDAVTDAYRKIEFEKRALELADRNLEVSRSARDLGSISSTDFRETQRAWLAARFRLLGARLQARLALVELERLSGTIRIE